MINKTLKILNFLIFLSLFANIAALANAPIKNIDKTRKSIVTINSRVPVSAYQNTGSWSGTGFIVDKKNGYLITNNHVTGRASIGTYFITFHNGQQAEAKLAYYDMYADFAVLKIDIADFPKDIEEITFTDEKPALGSDVFIVGNTEGQGFSFHSGYLSDLYDINGEMPQGSYIINMNSTGGASGSPVLNKKNEAIGVLYGGGKTHALALKGSYVQHVLKEFATKPIPTRQHIGIITGLYSLDKAVKHRNFDKNTEKQYIEEFPDSRNRVITVSKVLPGSTAESMLKPGDILWKINGKKIAADLALFDQEMNDSQHNIKLTIIRDGKELIKEIELYDLTKNTISRILDFAGALFFEADDFIANKTGINIGGVSLANVQTGSSFSSIKQQFTHNHKSIYRLCLKSINGNKINNLNDVITSTNKAIKDKYISIEYNNFQPYYPSFGANSGFISAQSNYIEDITFDSIDTKPRILKLDMNKLEWISEDF